MSTDRDVLRSRSHFDRALVVIGIKNGDSSPGPQSSDPSSLIAYRLDRLPGKFDISSDYLGTLHMYDLARTTCITKTCLKVVGLLSISGTALYLQLTNTPTLGFMQPSSPTTYSACILFIAWHQNPHTRSDP
jgi:hypothetical protein